MCTVCIVPVKRLRRTENVRGTFEGVSAPREFLQPSPLQGHRTPYYRVGSRHFRKPRDSSRGFFVCVATRHRLPTHPRCLPSICPSFNWSLRFIRPRLLAAFCSRTHHPSSHHPTHPRRNPRLSLASRKNWERKKIVRLFLITIGRA